MTSADGGTDSPYKSIEKDLNNFWTRDQPLMDITKYSDAVINNIGCTNRIKD
jgi:hypothetical protein